MEINGTDEYKRRCGEIAARNGIPVVNPELREIQSVPKFESPLVGARELALSRTNDKGMFITTSATEGKNYSGTLLGVFESGGRFYAVQRIDENRFILHGTKREDIPALEVLVGRDAEITSNYKGILNIIDSGSRYERFERITSRGR